MDQEGGDIWKQGFILCEKYPVLSRVETEDAVMPIPVFYEGATGKILKDTVPPEIRDEYDTI